MAVKFGTVDAYIESFPESVRAVLNDVVAVIRRVVPGVEASISYDMPTFSVDGRYLVYVAGWKKHISIYAVPDLSADLETAIAAYRSGSGTVQFPFNRPIPLDLIERIVSEMLRQRDATR